MFEISSCALLQGILRYTRERDKPKYNYVNSKGFPYINIFEDGLLEKRNTTEKLSPLTVESVGILILMYP